MYFKTWIVLSSTILMLYASPLFAQKDKTAPAIELNATPNKCVALRKGRTCYATIDLAWFTPVKGNYCIQRNDTKALIKCWQASKQGQLTHQFNSKQAIDYKLIDLTTGQAIKESQVKVTWVYKNKQKKRRWRLF